MVDKIYSKYFQKSRSFLFPVLDIKRNTEFVPSGVYMSLTGVYAPEDCKLICCFKPQNTEAFRTFEEQMLTGNPLFISKMQIQDYTAYVFDFESYTKDWDNVILGKYSQLSSTIKRAIKTYYGELTPEYQYIDSYINPSKHFSNYAKLLDIAVETLEEIGELCDPADLEKESLKIPVEDLENLKKNVIL